MTNYNKLATKWGRSYSGVMGYRCNPDCHLLSCSLRGSIVRVEEGFGIEDGADLAMIMHWSGSD